MGAAGELCNVVSRSTDVADVTESYTDTEARLKTLRLQEERLLEILSKATELSDVLELESRLSDVRYQIESYEATLRNYDSRVSYSTLHITLQEVVEYSIINDPPQTLGQRLSDGFKDSMRMVKNSAENALVWLVTAPAWCWPRRSCRWCCCGQSFLRWWFGWCCGWCAGPKRPESCRR